MAHARTLVLPRISAVPKNGFYLTEQDNGLALCRAGCRAEETPNHGIRVDLDSRDIRRRVANGKRLALARALGLHRQSNISVLDTTCGMGRDSAVLAAMGCDVTAIERHPALHALVADGLRRITLEQSSWLGHWLALHQADAREWLLQDTHSIQHFDAIYIDPMFDSPRRKAQPQRALQWMNELLGVDHDAGALLDTARHQARRVVVKSHARATPLSPPDHQIAGKAMRFDVYFNASKNLR